MQHLLLPLGRVGEVDIVELDPALCRTGQGTVSATEAVETQDKRQCLTELLRPELPARVLRVRLDLRDGVEQRRDAGERLRIIITNFC